MEETIIKFIDLVLHRSADLATEAPDAFQEGHFLIGMIFSLVGGLAILIQLARLFLMIRDDFFPAKAPQQPPKTKEQELRNWIKMQYWLYGTIIPPYDSAKYLGLPTCNLLALPPAKYNPAQVRQEIKSVEGLV